MAPGASDHSTYTSLHAYVYSSTPGGNISNWRTANWSLRLNSAFAIPSINAAPAIETYERNEAVTKALNEIADGKAQLGEGLATLGQTVRLFKNPVDGLVKAIRKIHNDRDLRPFLLKSYRDLMRAGISKTVANRYLEYVYGIVPLMQDIHGVSELAKSQLSLGQFLHGKARRNATCVNPIWSTVMSPPRRWSFTVVSPGSPGLSVTYGRRWIRTTQVLGRSISSVSSIL